MLTSLVEQRRHMLAFERERRPLRIVLIVDPARTGLDDPGQIPLKASNLIDGVGPLPGQQLSQTRSLRHPS